MSTGKILRIDPPYAVPGAEVTIDCEDLDTSDPTLCAVWFGDERAPIVALSPRRVLAIVPEVKPDGRVAVSLDSPGIQSDSASLVVGKRLAEDLHPVANPALIRMTAHSL